MRRLRMDRYAGNSVEYRGFECRTAIIGKSTFERRESMRRDQQTRFLVHPMRDNSDPTRVHTVQGKEG